MDSAHSSDGMILRDNVYGNINEDALRRDFTINALYYTTNGFRVLDFSTGLDDLEAKQIRIIGDPETRYREDPVRMLRAVRFAAKLDFEIEKSTAEPIEPLAELLQSISPARLFDETLKLFSAGHATKTFQLLRNSSLGNYIIAPTLESLSHADEAACRLVDLALENTDKRIAEGKSVTPYFLFAALLWPVFRLGLEREATRQPGQRPNYLLIANDAIAEQLDYTAIPKRISYASREIWELQLKLERRNRRSVTGLLAHPRFRAAYDFLLLREDSGEDLGGCGQWWTDFQFGDTNQQDALLNTLPNPKKRRKRRRKSSGNSVSGNA